MRWNEIVQFVSEFSSARYRGLRRRPLLGDAADDADGAAEDLREFSNVSIVLFDRFNLLNQRNISCRCR